MLDRQDFQPSGRSIYYTPALTRSQAGPCTLSPAVYGGTVAQQACVHSYSNLNLTPARILRRIKFRHMRKGKALNQQNVSYVLTPIFVVNSNRLRKVKERSG